MFRAAHRQIWRELVAGAMLLPAAAMIDGCGAQGPANSPVTAAAQESPQFGYTGSPVAATIVPANSSAALSKSYFGMTVHRLVASPSSSQPAVPFPAFSVHTFRLWDVVSWSMLEPASGQYNWTPMDQTVAVAQQNGVGDFIFTFGYVPAWASTNPADPCDSAGPGSCDAPDMTAFHDFATRLVRRYCGVVRYYETWNEPTLPIFWNGTNAQLLAVAQDLYRTAKDPANCGCTNGACAPGGGANPNRVLLPPIDSINGANLNWLDEYLAAAGSVYPYADVAAFHGYGYAQPEDIVQGIAQLKQTLGKHGLAGAELWDTEASWGTSTGDDQTEETSWLMRFHFAQAAAGVSRFIWYAYDNCAWGTLWGPACQDSTDNWQGVRLPGEAYANIEGWTNGVALAGCTRYENGLWACELRGSGDSDAWILWSAAVGAPIAVPISGKLGFTQVRDWQNNVTPLPDSLAVGQTPVLVEK